MTAKWFGPVWSVVGGGIGTILVVLAVMFRWPQVARLGPLQGVRPEPLPDAEARPPDPLAPPCVDGAIPVETPATAREGGRPPITS
jgi:hypothetical protein